MEKLEFETKFVGTITNVLEVKGGTSAKTGNSWKSQKFVLEESNVQHPQSIVFEVYGEEKINELNIQQGKEYEVYLDFKTNEYQGNIYNQVRAWKVVPTTIEQNPVAVANPVTTPAPQGDIFAPSEESKEFPF